MHNSLLLLIGFLQFYKHLLGDLPLSSGRFDAKLIQDQLKELLLPRLVEFTEDHFSIARALDPALLHSQSVLFILL